MIIYYYDDWEIILVKKKMYKYNFGLKISLVNTRQLFAIMWQR